MEAYPQPSAMSCSSPADRHSRRRRRGARPDPAAAARRSTGAGTRFPECAPPNIIITGTGPFASAGSHERHLNIDADGGERRIVHVADELLADHGIGPDRSPRADLRAPSTSPSARSSERGRALRARNPRRFRAAAVSTTSPAVVTFLPFFSVSTSGRFGIRIGRRLVVVGVVRRRLVAARAGTQRL